MSPVTRRFAFQSLLAGAALGSVLTVPPAQAQPAARPAQPDLVFHGRGFEPMMSHIVVGEKIEVVSVAADPLRLTSAPDAPEEIRQTVAPHGKTALHFGKPGLYLLYDAATTRFDDKVRQVVADRNAKSFPLPAYAVVLVTGANGRGLATTSAKINIPDSYMTFEPWAIVVNAGEPIAVTNNDMDMHIAMPSPEPMIMPNSDGAAGRLSTALWLESMQSFTPILLKGGGGKGVLTLSQPGLHHYFCPVHAAYDATAYTFAPLKSFGGYPFIMDGVIVVLPV
jgi:plastocyanin